MTDAVSYTKVDSYPEAIEVMCDYQRKGYVATLPRRVPWARGWEVGHCTHAYYFALAGEGNEYDKILQ